MSDAGHPATAEEETAPPGRYRLNRAGIHNVWQYDDHVFRFAEGRLLLRGRNGAGKSKALEMLLPFLLDGDARRLDTTGTSRTSLRWLLVDSRAAAPDAGAAEAAPTSTLGYLWIEFAGRDGADRPRWRTLGAAITASPGAGDARAVFFVTDRRVGEDLALVVGERPLAIDRLRAEVGPENCYDTATGYRARVMRELFGLDDPMRYRNLVHLLYRLRRPTVGERLEAGELVEVLSEALPPMDETVLDAVARNISDLDDARARLTGLRSARERVEEFLADYRRYLHGRLRGQAEVVRRQLDDHAERDAEVDRLAEELDRLTAAEGAVQEERDQTRRSRDTAAADVATLSAGTPGAPAPSEAERQARFAAVTAYIRAAEAAWAAASHALTTERQAERRLTADVAAIDRALTGLRQAHAPLADAARAAGVDPAELGEVPRAASIVLAPRESSTHVNLEGLEQAVERDPVPGVDLAELRGRLAELHDRLTRGAERGAEREAAATDLFERATGLAAAERRAEALADEAEWADAAVERAREREAAGIAAVRAASADYAAEVRGWIGAVRAAAPDSDLEAALTALEECVEMPLDDALRVLDADVPAEVARRANEIVDPPLADLRARRDTAVEEERELATELDDLSERRAAVGEHLPAPRAAWATAARDTAAGVPLYLAVDFADELVPAERAGLEAALEASGLLSGWIAPGGAVVDPGTRDLLLSPAGPVSGRSLADVLIPVEVPGSGVAAADVRALLGSVRLDPAGAEPADELGPLFHLERAAPASSAVSVDGRWRLGVAAGAHRKAVPEYIGEEARTQSRARHLAELDRRIAIAEALLAEAQERRGDVERQHDELIATARALPSGGGLIAAWAALDDARTWLAGATRELAAAQEAADSARRTALELRGDVAALAREHALPTDRDELAQTRAALGRLLVRVWAAHRELEALAHGLEDYRAHVEEWQRARADRVVAEDVRATAIGDMITVRRQTELTDRARTADPAQIEAAVAEVRARMDGAADRLPELERTAQRARDDRVAAESRLETARRERAEQARRALAAGDALRSMLQDAHGEPDPALLTAAGLDEPAAPDGALTGYDAARTAEPAERVAALAAFVDAVATRLDPDPATDVDDNGILRRREELHRALASTDVVGARTELTEPAGVKRLTVHDDDGAHDVTGYAQRLEQAIAEAEETVRLREEEAFERHLLGELAGHLSRQIEEARSLIARMNAVLRDVTTSQGLGVRLDWRLAPDADEDVSAVVPLLERPAEQRTRVETTRLRDALRRCIEAIRRLDPTAANGAQLRMALDYRSWFAFTVYVTDAAHPERERRLSHRTALSQGEQRVIAYLVLFATAAAQFDSLASGAPHAPRLILLDDAFAKVDEPTHGRLLGLLVELDLDFVLTSERVWGCFPTVPSLHIYECLRDPATPGIATLHFSWDGNRRRMVGV
ncbi:TIGR02680 family protein [Marinitenerispora sediminis]|uniref:TIGR02680 family protein n=1 Tax=Marinitenerispora sediminis TaxID=1931232 RepID=A0A368T0R1_9ACTN|nr:TIGR02680 family protein [Marinitenerispora sediminis]RCV52765.1 TIGR02680 family protein [Marinitenerispora sediminis]RCV55584.1 TIGR02680 family protein [Marinitenerispora sediminis]RCV61912.1 TIGR02680 family protein [Marinitenerispora sediminis]